MATDSYTAFNGYRRIASGALQVVALAVKRLTASEPTRQIRIFDNRAGRSIDIDTRGSEQEIAARFAQREAIHEYVELPESGRSSGMLSGVSARGTQGAGVSEPRSRGRPKLGVIAREVTLLPR